jgi:hypothetical protein
MVQRLRIQLRAIKLHAIRCFRVTDEMKVQTLTSTYFEFKQLLVFIKMNSPSTPKNENPREVLRRKLRENIEIKGMNRITKKNKEKILDKEMKKMGVDVEKFKAAIKTLNMEGQLEATLKKMN